MNNQRKKQHGNRHTGMKIFCVVALAVQLMLISSSCYFKHQAEAESRQASKELLSSLPGLPAGFERSRHLRDLEDYFDYAEMVFWVVVVVLIQVRKVGNTSQADLAIYAPFWFSFLLSFV
ncbi:hypothetical protein VA7868_02313 [Vibrio aerogenes CECT 7868]|uniref:Uncharacterized protein n=1 Tax=Vibrio aerogenes CECT 7868 TaxID=1216006 RepID=A0A1M5Z5E8_9VIBR|nr:hypothetical protein [Vibrio aerogenes]SHI19430.1 hypothetical protein VA7868_02313 [Vibrio aerogenes CECT 7868]